MLAETAALNAKMSLIKQYAPEAYFRTLFDPVQTHALYAIPVDQVEKVKALLKKHLKATRFRVVKPQVSYLRILCFKLNDR